MSEFGINRRQMLGFSSATALGFAFSTPTQVFAAQQRFTSTTISWLDGGVPNSNYGNSLGIPLKRGAIRKKDEKFKLKSNNGDIPVQTWPMAYWPDGSVKWLGVAAPPIPSPINAYALVIGGADIAQPLQVINGSDDIKIIDGALEYVISKRGAALVKSVKVNGRETMKNLKLLARLGRETEDISANNDFQSNIESVIVEKSGPILAVVKISGNHKSQSREWLPFTVRLYFYKGANNIKITHSFIFDGDAKKDHISAIGIGAEVPMDDEYYNRHIRFSGKDKGLWGEAVRPLTGLRRDSGRQYRDAQIKGEAINDIAQMPKPVSERLELIPTWGDFKLSQLTPDGFTIKKRTEAGQGYIEAITSTRANGFGYVGGGNGGVGFAIKDFWQRYPSEIDIKGANTELAKITAWLWSPSAEAMDLRPYRGIGKDVDYKTQVETLNITYEDYEPGWDDAYGIAHTSELRVFIFDKTPLREECAEIGQNCQKEPRLITSPSAMKEAEVFGFWTLPKQGSEQINKIENRINYQIDYYQKQIEQHRWYGFWNYGDFMHTYDYDRHSWRYDIGGYGWDNSELATDLWLWMTFVRSGRADIFRMAEAMTRQTGETDVYHIGRFKGFGTRHGVQAFSDSSKQPRVSNVAYRRIYYYLTADDRVGDLMHDLRNSEYTLKNVDISRKLGRPKQEYANPNIVDCGFGTSWGSFLAAWLTEWERTGDNKWRDRIINGMTSIAGLKNGWFAGGAPYDLETGRFVGAGDKISLSHLNCVFGVYEIQAELFPLLDSRTIEGYKKTWFEYCRYYNAPNQEIAAFLGNVPNGRALRNAHSRLSAWAGVHYNDVSLKQRASREFLYGESRNNEGPPTNLSPKTTKILPPNVLHEIDEDVTISTNDSAQWGLSAIANLALLWDELNV